MLLERDPQIVLGERSRGDLQLRIQCFGQRLHRPRLQMHRTLTDQRSRARAKRRPVIGDAPPRQRTEEPDRVVLGAVTLPVAGDDLLAASGSARLGRRVLCDVDHSIDQRRRVLPRHRLAKPGLPRDRAQPLGLIPKPEHLQARDRETSAAHSEVALECPTTHQRRVVVAHLSLPPPSNNRQTPPPPTVVAIPTSQNHETTLPDTPSAFCAL